MADGSSKNPSSSGRTRTSRTPACTCAPAAFPRSSDKSASLPGSWPLAAPSPHPCRRPYHSLFCAAAPSRAPRLLATLPGCLRSYLEDPEKEATVANTPSITDTNRPRPDRGPTPWAWIAIIIVIGAIFWIAIGGHGRRSRALANPASNSASAQGAANAVHDPAQLTASDAKDLVGQPVDIAHAQVAHSANGGAFLIDSNGTPVLVV